MGFSTWSVPRCYKGGTKSVPGVIFRVCLQIGRCALKIEVRRVTVEFIPVVRHCFEHIQCD
jgi:hypothetical protein